MHKKNLALYKEATRLEFLFTQIFVEKLESPSHYANLAFLLQHPEVHLLTKPAEYSPLNQDLVEQLITTGFGVTGTQGNLLTHSLALQANKHGGASYVFTAPTTPQLLRPVPYLPAHRTPVDPQLSLPRLQEFAERFTDKEGDFRPGVGTLSFEVSDIKLRSIVATYKKHAPQFIAEDVTTTRDTDGSTYTSFSVYMYPNTQSETDTLQTTAPDKGTMVRYVVRTGRYQTENILIPGLESTPPKESVEDTIARVKANQDKDEVDELPDVPEAEIYSDHWVTNLTTQNYKVFAQLMAELGFTTPVDFATGVVAAGDAAIESIVYNHGQATMTVDEAFTDRSTVFLPTNRKETDAGHVAKALEQIGSGIQHLAHRVKDLPTFIQKANDLRIRTNRGFEFLNIPRSYYGTTSLSFLTHTLGLSQTVAQNIKDALIQEGVLSEQGVLTLDFETTLATSDTFKVRLNPEAQALWYPKSTFSTDFAQQIGKSIYHNLYGVLGDKLTSEHYMKIVRNKVLVDIQGQDVLLQIFTRNVLQKTLQKQTPFLEFIQRVCKVPEGDAKVKGGCGGFGIRNFITLFLSIEISKAMEESQTLLAQSRNETLAQDVRDDFYLKHLLIEAKVSIYTSQMHQAQPLLTAITDNLMQIAELEAQLENDKENVQLQESIQAHQDQILQIKGQLKALNAYSKDLMTRVRLADLYSQTSQEKLGSLAQSTTADPTETAAYHALQQIIGKTALTKAPSENAQFREATFNPTHAPVTDRAYTDEDFLGPIPSCLQELMEHAGTVSQTLATQSTDTPISILALLGKIN